MEGRSSSTADDFSPAAEVPVNLVAATVAELAKADRHNSPAGQAAILLAYRLEQSAGDSGASVAAMVKEHRATLEEALKEGEKPTIVADLRKRRDAKRSRA